MTGSLIKNLYVVILLSLLLINPIFASDDIEKLKLEVEKLKLENANLKLKDQQQNPSKVNNENLKQCLDKYNIDLCFEFVGKDDEQSKSPLYSQDLKKIKAVAKSKCNTGKETACSLLGLILYHDEKDISAIPIMEKYCFSYNEKMSSRCHDLFDYYLGQGSVPLNKPDIKKANEIAHRCVDLKDYDSCAIFVGKFIQYPSDDPNITFLKISELAKEALKSKEVQSSREMNNYFQFIESCHISLAVEWKNRIASSTSHIEVWIRYKNLSKNPLQFSGELRAGLDGDPTKIFIYEHVGKTLRYERYLQPNELVREEANFRVDDKQSEKWLSHFKLIGFTPMEIFSTLSGKKYGADKSFLARRMCNFEIVYE